MPERTTRNFRLLALAGVLAAPAAVVLAILVALMLSRQQDRVRMDSIVTSRTLMADVDARAQADAAALRVLTSTDAIVASDWTTARRRARTVQADSPGWRAVLLTGPDGKVLFNTADALTGQRFSFSKDEPFGSVLGDVYRTGPGCPCVAIHARVRSHPGLTLSALVDAGVYQKMLLDHPRPNVGVVAVVDRAGRFIARSMDAEARVGTLGSPALRAAVARGGSGAYDGLTLEGQASYTSYAGSRLGPWSTHVASPQAYQDNPRQLLVLVVVAGALTALLASGGLAWRAWSIEQRERRTASEVLRLQKIEAVGRFTSSVAHDFNNLLTVIIGGLGPLVDGRAGEEAARRAAPPLAAARTGARLCNQLLSFARHGAVDTQDTTLGAIWDDVAALVEQSVGKGVTVRFEDQSNDARIRVNRDQIELALINLAVNARDAMEGHGQLELHASASDDAVRLRVSDTGPGVPAAIRAQIFDPFFTTKSVGRGTGLGLAQVLGAVRQAGGHIRVEDGPAGGACFTVTLPRA